MKALGRNVGEPGDDPRVVESKKQAPPIGEAGALCVAAWRDLESTRTQIVVPIGMGGAVITQSSIAWPRVKEWCEFQGLAKDETGIVVSVLRRLDGDRAKREASRIQRAASGR